MHTPPAGRAALVGAFVAALIVTAGPAAAGEWLTGNIRVVDGDTLVLTPDGDPAVRIRLAGVDAPEARQPCGSWGREWPCGRVATEVLRIFARSSRVRCRPYPANRPAGRDRYGRLVAICYSERHAEAGAGFGTTVSIGLLLAMRRKPIGERRHLDDADRALSSIRESLADRVDIAWAMVRVGLALDVPHFKPSYAATQREAEALGFGVHAGPYASPWRWRRVD